MNSAATQGLTCLRALRSHRYTSPVKSVPIGNSGASSSSDTLSVRVMPPSQTSVVRLVVAEPSPRRATDRWCAGAQSSTGVTLLAGRRRPVDAWRMRRALQELRADSSVGQTIPRPDRLPTFGIAFPWPASSPHIVGADRRCPVCDRRVPTCEASARTPRRSNWRA